MKKIITAILAGIFLLQCLSSCVSEEDSDGGLKDALKISAYLFDKDTPEPVEFDDKTTYTLEQLKLNEVRIMTPIWEMDMANLNIYFEFEGGICEVISEDKEIQLSVDNTLKPWHIENGVAERTFGFKMDFMNKKWVALCPMGAGNGHCMHDSIDVMSFAGYIGREYYLTVNAYALDNDKAPVIRAKLKFIQLEDHRGVAEWETRSRCFSIELTEYEYSDTYKMMEE